MNDCYFGKKDWRACREEVSLCRESHSTLSRLSSPRLRNPGPESRTVSNSPMMVTDTTDGSIPAMLEEEWQ